MPTQTPPPPAYTARFLVPSRTERGVRYTVEQDARGRFSCDCPAKEFPKTRGRCWHLKAAQAGAIAPAMQLLPTITTHFINSTVLAATVPVAETPADRCNRLLYA